MDLDGTVYLQTDLILQHRRLNIFFVNGDIDQRNYADGGLFRAAGMSEMKYSGGEKSEGFVLLNVAPKVGSVLMSRIKK